MIRSRTVVASIVLTSLTFLSIGRGAPQPATAPASDDGLIAKAGQAIDANRLAEFAREVDAPLREALADPDKADLAGVTQLAALREFAVRFGTIKTAGDDRTAKLLHWLLDQPTLMPTLVLAMSEQDAPDRVLSVLQSLRSEQDKALEEYADLTTAMCVVWDTPGQSQQRTATQEAAKADTARPAWLFRYLTGSGGKLRFNPKDLPWQLAIYVADNTVSQQEIAWAARRYGGRGAIGAVYFDVPYDHEAYYGTSDRRVEAHEYTLENLTKFGGVCADQAYFATAVARSLGVPAVYCRGQAATEASHAWVGYLDVKGKQVAWNFKEGRYEEYQFWRGEAQDPQTRETITESDVALLAALATSKPSDRLASIALVKSSALVAPEQLVALYTRAINISPGNRDAWMALANLGAERKLSDAQINQVTDVVARFAAKQYPDFALAVVRKLHSGRGNAQQLAALEAAKALFRARPDLLAELKIAQANLLAADNRIADALQAYGQVLASNRTAGPILLETLKQLDPILRKQNDLPRLAAIHKQAWSGMPQPQVSGYVRSTPYYMIGERYMLLLQQLGQDAEAQRVQARLDALNHPSKNTNRKSGRGY